MERATTPADGRTLQCVLGRIGFQLWEHAYNCIFLVFALFTFIVLKPFRLNVHVGSLQLGDEQAVLVPQRIVLPRRPIPFPIKGSLISKVKGKCEATTHIFTSFWLQKTISRSATTVSLDLVQQLTVIQRAFVH